MPLRRILELFIKPTRSFGPPPALLALAAALPYPGASAAGQGRTLKAAPSKRATAEPREETFLVAVDSQQLRVLIRHRRPTGGSAEHGPFPVLFVHGSSFPSALAAAYRIDGLSWMDDLASRGFDTWALDFLGYGGSDRYPDMKKSSTAHRPVGRAVDAERQIVAAARFIERRTGARRIAIIAHSWGTIPAGLFAADFPSDVDRLVDFGPIAQRQVLVDTVTVPPVEFVTADEERTRFAGYVPAGESQVLEPSLFPAWGNSYVATDSSSHTRSPKSVEVPGGPDADVIAAWSGHLAYDPARILAPVLIIRGEWDVTTRDADAKWLWAALSHAALKRDVKISRATHVAHLETGRHQLYAETAAFLAGEVAPGSDGRSPPSR